MAPTILLLGVSAMVAGETPQKWGTVEGRVVWVEKKIPVNPPIPGVPAALGPVLKDTLVINPQTKGVRWVLVWLADPKDARNAKFVPPIHPSLTNPPPSFEIDTPRGAYEPRVLGLWTKQNLTVNNTGAAGYTFRIDSLGVGPAEHVMVRPKTPQTVKGFVPKMIPTPFTSGNRPWMRGYVGTFAHPYFAVTDADGKFKIEKAPAGKFQLVLWQEEVGFLTMTSMQMRGKVIEINGKGVTDVGKIGMKALED
jgi:hypothetical protein